jgi:hypothetical protein
MSLAVEALVGVAALLQQQGAQQRALEVILVMRRHPSDMRRHNTHVEQLLGELVTQLSPNVVVDAQQRANEQNLDQLIEALLRSDPTQRRV